MQPDYLDKVDFIPVEYQALTNGQQPETLTNALLAREPMFYTQTTMISKPTTTGFTGLTSYSEADKVRFEVTQDYLIVRRAYEYVRNAPNGGTGIGQNPRSGDVVGVFKIQSHFDIRRAYNPQTGEELNVIEENSVDRPWYQRRYMRVDWSANLIDHYNSVLQYSYWDNEVHAVPVPVFVNNPQDPNAPVFQYSGSGDDRHLDYFDIVNRATINPPTMDFGDGYSNVPTCILSEDNSVDCAPSELTFRVAFRRVDPQRDYEPASLTVIPGAATQPPHLDMERFGFFDQNRVGFDPTHPTILQTQQVHWASRHNLWVHHHALAFGGDTSQGCNVDADCSNGNLCHIKNHAADATHRGMCAPLTIQHDHDPASGAVSCQSDWDCRPDDQGQGGLSNTAVCDTSSHTCGEHYFRCSSDDDCASVDPQSHCDLAIAYNRPDNRGLCLMPFRQRQVRPIAYHETPNYPSYMQAVTEQIVHEWNDAFVQAVVAARRHECEIEMNLDASTTDPANNPCNDPAVTGYDPTITDHVDTNPTHDAQFIYVGCHSPVVGTDMNLPGHTDPMDPTHNMSQTDVDTVHNKGWDLAACGTQGTVARLGDMRYSQIGAITDHDVQGYWGLANIASDPETGEMVVGRGAVWQTITDYYSTYLVDLIKVLNGDMTVDQIADGSYLVESMRQIGNGTAFGASGAHLDPASQQQSISAQVLDNPLRQPGGLSNFNISHTGLANLRLQGSGWLTPATPLISHDVNHPGALDTVADRLAHGRVLGDGVNTPEIRRRALQGDPLEGALMNEDQNRLAPTAAFDPTGALPTTLSWASPFRGQSPAVQHAIQRMRSSLSAWQCGLEAGSIDDMLLGLAQRLAGPNMQPINHNDPDDASVAFGRDWNFRPDPNGPIDYNLMTQYAASFIHHGVLAHELGHSLGQRHNFTASADAVNYFDNYWKHRGDGHMAHGNDHGIRPRYEYVADAAEGNSYYSDAEIAARVDEYAYSSVMDYKGFNEDAHGIGHYDYAFIKNGYVGMVEAFRQVPNNDAATTYAMNMGGAGFSTPLDLRDWAAANGNGPIHGMHYTQIPQIFGQNEDGTPNIGNGNRYNVFLHETTTTNVAGLGSPSFSNVTVPDANGTQHVLVPYRFDTDERAGLVWQDQRYDAGADAYESLHYVTERYLNYYFANSFARYRANFSTGSYVSRMWGRYLEQLHQTTQLLLFDLTNYQDFFPNNAAWQAYVNSPAEHGGYVNQVTMSMAADTMVAQLTMPEVGAHIPATAIDGTTYLTPNTATGQGTQIPINLGRGFESQWRNDVGFWWYEQFNRVGAYYDKMMSLDVMTDPELYLLGRDTPTDIRIFQVNYYTLYPAQIIRLFGGLLSEDYRDFAPIMNASGRTAQIQRTHLQALNLPEGAGADHNGRVFDSNHLPLDPQDHFTAELRAVLIGMIGFPATYDHRYLDYARIWLDGGSEAIDIDNSAVNTVFFTDPWTHQTYRAQHFSTIAGEAGADVGASASVHVSLGNAPADEAGIGARMLLHARDLDAARQAATDPTVRTTIETELRKYIDLLNVTRLATRWFNAGGISL